MMEFRKLRADEIDCRVASVKKNGVSLLLYKDARCDMNILDETVGADAWQRRHEVINGNLFCNVGIRCREEWIWKQDVGTESYTEKEKGQASDSFKRACFNWGIGRELYTAPFIWMPASKCNIADGKCYDSFRVTRIKYAGNVISELEVVNEKTKGTYHFGTIGAQEEAAQDRTIEEELDTLATIPQKKCIEAMCTKHKVDIAQLYNSNKLTAETLTKRQASILIHEMKKKFGE